MSVFYNDFLNEISSDGKTKTLTVTITLAEYKELLGCARDLEHANAKIEELENINKIYAQMFLKEHPELTDNFSKDLQYMIDGVAKAVRESEVECNVCQKEDD